MNLAAGQLSRLNDTIEQASEFNAHLVTWLVIVSILLALVIALIVYLFWSMTRPEDSSPRGRWIKHVEEDLADSKPIVIRADSAVLDGIRHVTVRPPLPPRGRQVS